MSNGRGSGRLRALSGAAILSLSGAAGLFAHAGAPCLRPKSVAAPPRIDGSIDPADGWGAPIHAVALGGTTCTDPVQRLFAVRAGARTFVAVDVPETTADDRDTLLVFVDGDHSGAGAPDASDRAIRLVGFAPGTNRPPSGVAEVYEGTGTGWSPARTFSAARTSRTGSGPGARMVVELELPTQGAPVGFAAAFVSGDRQDCDGDSASDGFLWPPALPLTIVTPPGLAETGRWGDLGCTPPAPPPLECRDFKTEGTCRAQHPDCRWGGATLGCLPI
jgi:hypothetical protein